MSQSGQYPQAYNEPENNVLGAGNPQGVPTFAFNPSSGYFASESSSYKGGRARKNKSKKHTRKSRKQKKQIRTLNYRYKLKTHIKKTPNNS
jgi:hypothetical protein